MMHTSDSHLKQIRGETFSALGSIVHAMAAPVRLRIVQILSNRPHSVEELSQRIGESIANTSQHLQKLKKAGLVADSRSGLKRTYSLVDPSVTDALIQFQKIASNLLVKVQQAEAEFCPSDMLPDQTLSEILNDVQSKKAMLIDVRDQEEFEATPAPMAHFFPRDKIQKNLESLSKKKVIYAYCRGRYCYLANDVVRDLRKRGYRAYRLREMSHEIVRTLEQMENS